MLRRLGLLTAAFVLPACTTTTTEVRSTPLGPGTALLPPNDEVAVVGADWAYGDGVLRGTLRPLPVCQQVDFQAFSDEQVEIDSPGAGTVVSTAVGVAITALSVWLISEAGSFSDEETCTEDDGEVSCTSDRQNGYVFGGLGFALGAGIAGVSVYRLIGGPQEEVVATEIRREETGRHGDGEPCWTDPIAGLGLSVLRVDQVVARSTTNDHGEVAFAIPSDITGDLQVMVDAVPESFAERVEVGLLVGQLHLEP